MSIGQDYHAALLKLTNLFAEGFEFALLIQKMLEVSAETLIVERVSIWIFDTDRNNISLYDLFDCGPKNHIQGGRLSRSDYPSYFRAVESSPILIIDDVSYHDGTVDLLSGYLKPLGITSMLDVPIRIEGKLYGVVCHEHKGPPRQWTPDEYGFASSIANLVGQAFLVDQLRQARLQVQASEIRSQQIFSSSPVALLLVNSAGKIVNANQKAIEVFRASRETLEESNIDDLLPSHIRGYHAKLRELYSLKPQQKIMSADRELIALRQDGTEIPVEVGLCPLSIDDEQHVICAVTDIKDRKTAESRLKVLYTAIEQTPATVIIMDASGTVEYVNSHFTVETGREKQDILGSSYIAISGGFDYESGVNSMWQTLKQGKPWSGELVAGSRMGKIVWEEVHMAPVKDSEGKITHYVAIKLNITERKEHEAKLRYHALHDHLTGLPNRQLLSDQLHLAMDLAQRNDHQVALMFVDLDHFKLINDSMGHEVGDLVLKETSLRMREQLRAHDLVARIGGDEFVVLLFKVMTSNEAASIAERIRESVKTPVSSGITEVNVTCSIGIALFPEHAASEIELYRCADQALYKVKERGRNSIYVF